MVNVYWLTCIVFGIVSFLLGGNWETWLAASFVILAIGKKDNQ